ncbi:MAG: transcription elongation factor GreA [Rhodospirillales bacterium]|nr:transcription elongation factor GreA [Rhodospirillales bacterium]
MEKTPMTAEGLANLETERDRLVTQERPAIIRAIAAAREHGDLSENAEYHAARERQSFVEGRLAEIEDLISRAEVIDPSKIKGSTVRFGARVKVVDEETEDESVFMIVGSHEADIAKRRISITSPLARAMIGKKKGDIIEVNAPSGPKSYEILSVRFR